MQKYTKELIDGAYDNDKVIVKTVTNPTDEASAKAFLKQARALYKKLSFPSTEYNAYSKFSGAKGSITTWTEPDRVVLIIKADAMAEIDVEALAAAFNLDKANFLGRVIEVDRFENDNIIGVICDESWLQIYDNIFRFDEFYNARVMAWNEYLHAWSTFAICPFANAVVLATEEPVPATQIAFDKESTTLNLSSEPKNETLTVTLTPSTATTDVEYTSSDQLVFTARKDANNKVTITAVGEGSGKLTAKTDNGLTASIDVTVNA